MKNTIAILATLMLLSDWAAADEDDKPVTSTVRIEGGQLIGEKQEIEIYDYHTGTYQTVDVYRKPNKTLKKAPEAAKQAPSTEQTPH